MVGPSSSYTAGAVRLGRTARYVLGGLPEHAEIIFYGSFATTYCGHGTDLAMIAGLLDFDTDDMRIKDAFAWSEATGLEVQFRTSQKASAHPNTATLILRCGEKKVTVTGMPMPILVTWKLIESQEVVML
mgnify:CR=1 FL=1